MIELTYTCGNEIFKFQIDRPNKKLKECSSKTHYDFVETKWNHLFDRGKETAQDHLTARLSDEDFIKAISYFMFNKYGYTLKEKKCPQ